MNFYAQENLLIIINSSMFRKDLDWIELSSLNDQKISSKALLLRPFSVKYIA